MAPMGASSAGAAGSAGRLEVTEPLGAGEVLGAALREYGRHPLTYVSIGAVEALAGLSTYAAFGIPTVVGLAIVAVAFVACFAATVSVASGWSRHEALIRMQAAAPALAGLVLIVGVPATLGRIDAVLTLLAIVWLSITSFAVPIVMREQRDERVGWRGMLVALRRSFGLAQAAFMHAVLVVFILYAVTVLITSLLAGALDNWGDQGELAAFVISRAVLVPIVFIGLAMLYLNQRARLRGSAAA